MAGRILPVLAKHRATAQIAGHDHYYERSEPDCGVTVIITGGSGAPLYDAKVSDSGAPVNPHSKVLVKANHYCSFSVRGDRCTMRAIDLDGHVLDTREWNARPSKDARVNRD